MKYAENTSVSSELSRIDIEKTLIRYGASGFAYASKEGAAMIAFTMNERQIKLILPLPRRDAYKLTPTGKQRTENSQQDAWEQACRQRWRALLLVIKAKLEGIADGILIFDNEFMADIVLPGGGTVGDLRESYLAMLDVCGPGEEADDALELYNDIKNHTLAERKDRIQNYYAEMYWAVGGQIESHYGAAEVEMIKKVLCPE